MRIAKREIDPLTLPQLAQIQKSDNFSMTDLATTPTPTKERKKKKCSEGILYRKAIPVKIR
jgi:hypothetical protein